MQFRLLKNVLYVSGLCFAIQAQANPYPYGEALTTGSASSGADPAYLGQNPAMLDAVTGKNRGVSMQLLNIGAVIETGRAETLIDDFDLVNTTDVDLSNLSETVDDLNIFLGKVGNDAYVNGQYGVDVLSPFSLSLGEDNGTLAFNLRRSDGYFVGLLGGNVSINQAKLQDAIVKQGANEELSTADYLDIMRMTSSLYVKTKKEMEYSLSYAKTIYKKREGNLSVGARANLHEISLSKEVFPAKQYLLQQANHEEDSSVYEDSAGDVLLEDIKNMSDNEISVQTVTVDVGVSWYSDQYDVGFLIKNINQPYVDFPRLGFDCEASYNPSSCYYALSLSDQINLSEHYFFTMQPRIEGHAYTEDRTWTVGGYYEVWQEDQPLGPSTQWAGLSMVYSKPVTSSNWFYRWLLPSARFGYHANLAGSAYHYYALGLSWFGLHVDLMTDPAAIDLVLGNSDDIPHVFGGSVGYNLRF